MWHWSLTRSAMSELGQKAKYSLRAHLVCFAPDNGLKSDIAGGPFRAKSGTRRLYSMTLSALASSVAGEPGRLGGRRQAACRPL